MDDNGNIIYYIILGAIYLLSRVFGKKKKQPVKQKRQPVNRPVVSEEREPINPPTMEKEAELSFEDILRELSGATQPKPKADPTPEPASAMEAFEQEARIEPAPLIEDRPQPAYAIDEMDQIASEFKVPKPIGSDRLPEPDMSGIMRKQLSFQREGNYVIEKKEKIDYLKILREKDGPAKAFVMGEIFNRKY